MTGNCAGLGWNALRLLREEPDQVQRLRDFRAAHPEMIIGGVGFGVWQARIPESDGEQIISRYTVRELLDKLDELTVGSQTATELRRGVFVARAPDNRDSGCLSRLLRDVA